MRFQTAPTETIRQMFADWKKANPQGTEEDLAEWLFDTFEDIQLSSMKLTRELAKNVMAAPDWKDL